MREMTPPAVAEFLGRFGIELTWLDEGAAINGSFWGAPEAGIAGARVYVRPDTPVHSFLHEVSHIVCMPADVRAAHKGDAKSDDLEESAVCFLQILLADCLQGVGRDRLMADMDDWGYSFRLGSTAAWFAKDADDAREWLLLYELIDQAARPTYKLRTT